MRRQIDTFETFSDYLDYLDDEDPAGQQVAYIWSEVVNHSNWAIIPARMHAELERLWFAGEPSTEK